jgi:UDP-glucose 4-epimerase
MNVLVTGGAGYVGCHAVRALQQAAHGVWVYDNLALGHRRAVGSAELIEGDLADGPKLRAALTDLRIDAVLHFAALSQVGESVVDPARYYLNNVSGSLSLLEAMRAAGVWRFVLSSTAAVYGLPDQMPISEQVSPRPINPYGAGKLAVERILSDYAAAYGLGFAALRYFNAAGASLTNDIGEDHDPETHLIPLILQVALGQRPSIRVFGDDYPTPDGTCIRDYIHVDDLASAHVRALERLKPGVGLIANLGTGQGFSVRQVIEACGRVTGREIPVQMAPRRAGDPPALVADPTVAGQLLEWRARHSDLQTIVASAWRWHSAHPQGYDD